MTEKNFLFINFFCVKYFRFQFIFYVKIATPNYSKIEILSSSCFCKFGWRVTPLPPAETGGGRVEGVRTTHQAFASLDSLFFLKEVSVLSSAAVSFSCIAFSLDDNLDDLDHDDLLETEDFHLELEDLKPFSLWYHSLLPLTNYEFQV